MTLRLKNIFPIAIIVSYCDVCSRAINLNQDIREPFGESSYMCKCEEDFYIYQGVFDKKYNSSDFDKLSSALKSKDLELEFKMLVDLSKLKKMSKHSRTTHIFYKKYICIDVHFTYV